jgi:hypothetical protein
MNSTSEIKALFTLIDDPDRNIYTTVSDKLIDYGKDIIPNLESLWEDTTNLEVQERIKSIIHKVNYKEVCSKLNEWVNEENPSILKGAIHLASYNYANLDEQIIRKTIKSIYQSCWLELNNYLTPLEQINIVNSIFYNMYKFKGFDIEENKTAHYFINEVIDTRHGNNYSLGLLYQSLCDMLDIPVYAIQLPRQYLLAYFDTVYDFHNSEKQGVQKILFYIDANNGMIYSKNDIDAYIKKYNLIVNKNSFNPLTNKQIVIKQIEALMKVYEMEKNTDRVYELQQILEFPYYK